MGKQYTILIADRNRHVREFLKREMLAEGYQVRLAKTTREVLTSVYHPEPLDLVILDLDLPEVNELGVLEKIQDRIPTLPLVLHSFNTDYAGNRPDMVSMAVFVEKSGDSIEGLKKVVSDLLHKSQA